MIYYSMRFNRNMNNIKYQKQKVFKNISEMLEVIIDNSVIKQIYEQYLISKKAFIWKKSKMIEI